MWRWRSLVPIAALAAALMGCGGGGGRSSAESVLPEPAFETSPFEELVVLYDVTGDDDPDLVTLDRTATPMTIVDLVAAAGTGAVDRSDDRRGEPIDAAVSEALSVYLAESAEVAGGEVLDVVESSGRATTVVVYE